jgi:hypothetical protein
MSLLLWNHSYTCRLSDAMSRVMHEPASHRRILVVMREVPQRLETPEKVPLKNQFVLFILKSMA